MEYQHLFTCDALTFLSPLEFSLGNGDAHALFGTIFLYAILSCYPAK